MDSPNAARICSLGGGSTTCTGTFQPSKYFSKEDLYLMKIRRELHSVSHIVDVCEKHFQLFSTRLFEYRETKCCDPFDNHTSSAAPVCTISLDMHYGSKQVSRFSTPLIPGKKLCKRCHTIVRDLLKDVDHTHDTGSSASSSQAFSQDGDSVQQLLVQAGSIENVIAGPSSAERIYGPEKGSMTRAEIKSYILGPPPAQEMVSDSERVNIGIYPSEGSQQESQQNISVDLFEEEGNGKHLSEAGESDGTSSGHVSQDPTYTPSPRDSAIKKLNTILEPLNVTPVQKRKLTSVPSYGQGKLKKIEEECEALLIEAGGIAPPGQSIEKIFYEKTMSALKSKFSNSSSITDKVAVLSIALVSMSWRKVLEEFQSVGATEYMIKKTKELMKEQDGILPVPAAKKGRVVSTETVQIVQNFYEEDNISSRQMPGKKDFLSVREGDKKVHKQKRLILCTLKELHQTFKKQFPDIHISFSKFASLRPKHCVLAGSAGTHSVCVCV